MVKTLITGSSGLLGRAVRKTCEDAGHDVTPLSHSQTGNGLVPLDLTEHEAVTETFSRIHPNIIIHCAAERRPDVAEKDPAAAEALNVDVSRQLALVAKDLAATLVYVSTDYVFDGSSPPYELDATPNPLNLYGRTKLAGEQAVREAYPVGSVILRVPVLYGAAPKPADSAVNVLLNAVRGNKPTDMDDYAVRLPTCVEDVARVLKDIGERYSHDDAADLPRILHFSAQTTFTKYTMAMTMAKILNTATDHLVRMSDPPGPDETPRPRDCHLSNKVLANVGISVAEKQTFEQWWRAYLSKTS